MSLSNILDNHTNFTFDDNEIIINVNKKSPDLFRVIRTMMFDLNNKECFDVTKKQLIEMVKHYDYCYVDGTLYNLKENEYSE